MRLILNLANLFLRGTALMLGLMGAFAGLACWGGMFSDRLDTLTHLAPIWLTCGALALILAMTFSRDGERRAIVGLALVAVIAIGALMAPELLTVLRQTREPAGASTVKLVQFNLWVENREPGATLDWIIAQKADLVIVEEGGGRASLVIRRLREVYPNYITCAGRRRCDTWIFSRSPITQGRGFYQDRHPLAAAWATVRDPSGDFTVAGAHYGWPVPAGLQRAQSRILVDVLKPFAHDSLIVAGDFNSTPWSWTLRRQDKALGLKRRTRALASWPTGGFSRIATAPFPLLPIDHVYAGKAWKTVKVERGPSLGSDHRPIVVTLTR
ncbi:endonuclease/exonuclease/phosphatase family protein [Caulobacter sp.]|uniref:endonuclease/exonuclease/phosphatase family protein n=1 Tax=Caulobacter sp. TaxID=78 RepID=UPI003BB0414C